MPFGAKPAYFKAQSLTPPAESLVMCRLNKRWLIAVLQGPEARFLFGRMFWNIFTHKWELRLEDREWNLGQHARYEVPDIRGDEIVASTC